MKMNHGVRPDPEPESLPPVGAVLSARRIRRGLRGNQLAMQVHMEEQRLEDLEAGRAQPTPAELARLARGLGTTANRILGEAELIEKVQGLPDEPMFDSALETLSWAADFQRNLAEHLRAMVTPDARPCTREAGPERRLAEDSWRRLEPLSPTDRKAAIGGHPLLAYPHFMRWGLAEKLCMECEAALGDDPRTALDLADLALHVAERVGGDPAWRRHLQGYTWAFIAKAKLAGGDRAGAEEAVARGWELWNPGCLEEPDFLKWPEMPGLDGSLSSVARAPRSPN